jgi:UDP-N-acetyl-D-mannosaminuronic acid dehydrogenase
MNFDKICVLGLGYIGLPTAAMFATHGLDVVGVDIDQEVVEILNNGDVHIKEPGLKTVVQAAIRSGNLCVACEPEPAEAFIITVPTPLNEDKGADMRAVTSAAESIVPHLQEGNLVILESTSPPRTTVDLLQPILEGSGLKAGEDFLLAYSPERVLPGRILNELVENSRVIGGINQASAEAGRNLYQAFVQGETVLADATTAEMVKLMENTYRDVNIAIANEFSRLADRFEVEVWEAIEIANRHPRVEILRPGPGVGGHCISVDPWFFVEAAPDLTPLIRAAREVNDAQPGFVVDLVRRTVDGDLTGKRIAALGLAYKANVDDLRESPAIEVARALQEAGADVRAFEPFKPEVEVPGVATVARLKTALEGADVLLLLVGHRQFLDLDPSEVAQITTARLVVDAVNGWKIERWKRAGFRVRRLGVGASGKVRQRSAREMLEMTEDVII